jgi:hypothetical protein
MEDPKRALRALIHTLFHTAEGWVSVMSGPVSLAFTFLEKRSAVGGEATSATEAWSLLVWASAIAGIVAVLLVMFRLQSRILDLDDPVKLRAGLIRQPEHDRPTSFRFFVRVWNYGPKTAENVHAQLLGVRPRPRYGAFEGHYPQPIGLPINRAFDTTMTRNPPGRTINASQPVDFDLAETWLSGEGGLRYLSGLDGFDDRHDGNSKHNLTRLDEGEVVQLRIRVSAANAEPCDINILVTPRGDDLNMRIV